MAQLKKLVKEVKTPRNYKATDSEHKAIRANADKYTDGNVSEWVRYAAMNYKPSKSEIVQ